MTKTVQHQTLDKDESSNAIDVLQRLPIERFTFVQLRRLRDELKRTALTLDAETKRRENLDDSGDTVEVPAPGSKPE